MSGKCIITVPQDNQSKPSIVLWQRTLPNILGYMSWALKTQHHGLIWIQRGSPEL